MTDNLKTTRTPDAGMTCAACSSRLEKNLNRLEGVTATCESDHRNRPRRIRPGAGSARRSARTDQENRLQRAGTKPGSGDFRHDLRRLFDPAGESAEPPARRRSACQSGRRESALAFSRASPASILASAPAAGFPPRRSPKPAAPRRRRARRRNTARTARVPDFRLFTLPLLAQMAADAGRRRIMSSGCRPGCNGCSPHRCSSGPENASTAAPGTVCAAAAPIWTCWWCWAPAPPICSASR
jgi:cation transport ATPase